MTYVSKKEKVFDLPEQDEASSVSLNMSETRLKRFPSVSDRRAWTSEECQRYQHLYGLVNGSESSISKSTSFKYIPFDVLLAILMAEKDAYIQELLEKQDERSCCGGKLYKAEGFEDSDDDREALIRKDAEVVALKNKISGLESELEDYRDTLTKAMHKLETMDAIMSENSLLREKIDYSEETIRCLEDKKAELEKELEYFKSSYNVSTKSDNAKCAMGKSNLDGGDCEEIVRLSSEREILIQKVEELQKELERMKMIAAEMEALRKISETTTSSLEEISKENECYKKKLESMKCLEKHIEELKNQAHTLTDKYKRESQKASDQQKQINVRTKEIQALREERNRLEERVNELTAYESQYLSLQAKLHQVEAIIDENEILNHKLIQLDKLELENEQLKMRMEQLKCTEIQVAEDKEKIVQLQYAVAEREDEMRKMLKQIEELSKGYSDKNEIRKMRNELEEKNGKLKKYEKQLAEIPILESEIDELKIKLQKCIDNVKTDKDLLKKLQEELEACRKRCHELETMSASSPPGLKMATKPAQCTLPETSDKSENTLGVTKQDAVSQSLKQEYKEQSIEALLVDIGVHKLRELEEQNKVLKSEVEVLRLKLSKIDLDDLISQTTELKEVLNAKDKRIVELEIEIGRLQKGLEKYENVQELKNRLLFLEEEVKRLKEFNQVLEEELSLREDALREAKELKECLEKEKKARSFAMQLAKEMESKYKEEIKKREAEEAMSKLHKEEANIAKQKLQMQFSEEIESLKRCTHLFQTLVKDLKTENKILRKMKEYSEITEKNTLRNLISKLKAEVKLLRSLSGRELQGECDSLREKVKKLLNETDTLMGEIEELKSALEAEKSVKDYLEKELVSLRGELTACLSAGNEVLNREIAVKEATIASLQKEISETRNDLDNATNEAQVLREENVKLFNNYNNLKSQQKDLENNVNWLVSRIDDYGKTIKAQEEKQNDYVSEINRYKEMIEDYSKSKDSAEKKTKSLEEEIKKKEAKIEELLELSSEIKKELNKANSEMEVLKSRLAEKETSGEAETNYEKDLEEKYALEEALRKIEHELDDLKVKLEECKMMEEEMTNLRSKRDSLLEKMSVFEMEIDELKKKLCNFENLKIELEQLKSEKKSESSDRNFQPEIVHLELQLEEKKAEVEKLTTDNANLKEELQKAEDLLDVCRKLQNTIPQQQSVEFFTPPALPSPHSSETEIIPLERHRKEMADLETHYRDIIDTLSEENAVKIRKLLAENEKEAELRSKTYNDNVNYIKSSYENDIRKLAEKHKSSILRLQDFHEYDIQEMNKSYETQMEAMQKQNENLVNDLKTESVEKCKQLTEKYNREIKELREKFEDFQAQERSNAESSLTESTNDIREVHKKQAVDSLKEFYQNSILELEEKHSREMKKCKKNNLKIVELMKKKYEALLVEERKKYEEQLEELLLQLKQGQRGDTLECETAHFPSKKIPVSVSGSRLDFLEVLQKIINEGLEALTFDELILVHSKTCFMPESVGDDGAGGEDVPAPVGVAVGVGRGCKHRWLMTAEKEELLKRIFTLEHDIVIKQLETHEAIVNMETAEKCRIQELETALATVQQKNIDLKRFLSTQSKLQMDLKIEKELLDRHAALQETNVIERAKELERERTERKRLEEELQVERTNVKHLTATLEAERERFRSRRKRDSKYVESIRLRLEEALNHEQMMESQLDCEARFRATLESELQALQKSFSLITDLPPGQVASVESKAAKDIKNQDQCESVIEDFDSRKRSRHKTKSKVLLNL